MELNSLEELFWEELRDLHNAENQITKALPKMISKCGSAELKAALEEHLEVTRDQITRLEELFTNASQKSGGKVCKGMQGLIEEGDEHLKEEADPDVRDAMIISLAQRVEHYEMAGYGCVRTWAKRLGWKNEAKTLQEILDEEGDADKKLTQIAERGGVNREAMKQAA